MKKKITYEENPFDDLVLGTHVWHGRLPTPEEIAAMERTTKITLSVTSASLATVKAQAKKIGVPYQVMIRRLLDAYSQQTMQQNS